MMWTRSCTNVGLRADALGGGAVISWLTPQACLTFSGKGGGFGQQGWVPTPLSHDRLSLFGKTGTVPSSLSSPLLPRLVTKMPFLEHTTKKPFSLGLTFSRCHFLVKGDANVQIASISEELAKKTEDAARQQEEITHLLSQIVDLQKKAKAVRLLFLWLPQMALAHEDRALWSHSSGVCAAPLEKRLY